MEENKNKFKSTIILRQVTPMIHFQANDYGACLRATDVKPRLDKFILNSDEKLKNSYTEYKKWIDSKKSGKEPSLLHKDWFIDSQKNPALDYRMTISIGDTPDASITTYREEGLKQYRKQLQNGIDRNYSRNPEEDKETIKYIDGIISNDKIEENEPSYVTGHCPNPQSFFGNMVSGDGKDKCNAILSNYREGIIFSNDITMTIFSRKTDLLKEITSNIEAFFLTNNFGTRSDKGLGSFYVTRIDGKDINLDGVGKKVSSSIHKPCYTISCKKSESLEVIRMIYALMKSGINYTKFKGGRYPDDYFKGFIYRYFFRDGGYYKNKNEGNPVPRNDKAYMKRELFDTRGKQDEDLHSEEYDQKDCDNEKYLYVRAMLGVPDYMEFRDNVRKGKVDISAADSNIERVPSPIVFKVLPDEILIIPQEIDDALIDAKFLFSNEKQHIKNKKICTPSSFNIIDFLDCFMDDFNDKKSPKCGKIGLRDAEHPNFKVIKTKQIVRID